MKFKTKRSVDTTKALISALISTQLIAGQVYAQTEVQQLRLLREVSGGAGDRALSQVRPDQVVPPVLAQVQPAQVQPVVWLVQYRQWAPPYRMPVL